MARPDYFSCARCGWRGILAPNATHDCIVERLVAPPIAPAARMTAFHASGPTSARLIEQQVSSGDDEPDEKQREIALGDIARESSRLVGRHIAIIRDTNWKLTIGQRCAVCRDEIAKTISWPGMPDLRLAIAKTIKHSYLLHRCKPVDESLFSLSYAELEDLGQQLESDMTRIAERAAEVEALLRRKAGG